MKQSIPVRTQSKQSKHVPTPPARVQAPSTLSLEEVGTADTSGDITVRSRKVSFTTATFREDTFLARIENDESIAAIAASLGADRSTLSKWLVSGAPRFGCAREARGAAAAVHIGHPASQYRGGGAEGPAVLGHAELSFSVSEFWN